MSTLRNVHFLSLIALRHHTVLQSTLFVFCGFVYLGLYLIVLATGNIWVRCGMDNKSYFRGYSSFCKPYIVFSLK